MEYLAMRLILQTVVKIFNSTQIKMHYSKFIVCYLRLSIVKQ